MANIHAEESASFLHALESLHDPATTLEKVTALRQQVIDRENGRRGLFARHRQDWHVPEIADTPLLGLVDVFAEGSKAHRCLSEAAATGEGKAKLPCCFLLGAARLPAGASSTVESLDEFKTSWDCFTEGQLRFLCWDNVLAAGGAVAGCLMPLPAEVKEARAESFAAGRRRRRKFFHDEAYTGSDVDLFIYGLDESEAEAKLQSIFEAVQAANPYEVRCFRSAHAVTLVSQYPFRHIQIVLRLYSSPAEVLCGFDVDSCACGWDGERAYFCQRTALAFASQANTVDLSRRSPSYEMRLSKYATRGFEVIVPVLQRARVDPYLFEKRWDQVRGLARLLLLERLRTPADRFRYKMEQRLKNASGSRKWQLNRELAAGLRDKYSLDREDEAGALTSQLGEGNELSNYSTVFLPWGPKWNAESVSRLMAKKDRVMNSVEFLSNGRVQAITREFRIHFFASSVEMADVIADPFPDDPPLPDDVAKDSLVFGRIAWIVDNPGRQQIGSFHPIDDGAWTEGAFISDDCQRLVKAAAADDVDTIRAMLGETVGEKAARNLLLSRDFLGRSALHVAAAAHAETACDVLLSHPAADEEMLQLRLSDGRFALHVASAHGFCGIIRAILTKADALRTAWATKSKEEKGERPAWEKDPILDVDGADWDAKLSALQYAVLFGNAECVEVLLAAGADPKKLAVNKSTAASLSTLELCSMYATNSKDLVNARRIAIALFEAGATTIQVNPLGQTVWHTLAGDAREAAIATLELFLEADVDSAKSINIVSKHHHTPLLRAINCLIQSATIESGSGAFDSTRLSLLLSHGAKAQLTPEEFHGLRAAGGNHCHQVMKAFNLSALLLCIRSLNPNVQFPERIVEAFRLLLAHDPSLALLTFNEPHRPHDDPRSLLAEIRSKLIKADAILAELVSDSSANNHRQNESKAQEVLKQLRQRRASLDSSDANVSGDGEAKYNRTLYDMAVLKQDLEVRRIQQYFQQFDMKRNNEGGNELELAKKYKQTLNALAELVASNGGTTSSEEDAHLEAEQVTARSSSGSSRSFGYGFFGRSALRSEYSKFSDPLRGYKMGKHALPFGAGTPNTPANLRAFQDNAHPLFCAVSSATASVVSVHERADVVPVVLSNSVGVTLLQAAVAVGDATIIEAIVAIARKQHAEWKKRQAETERNAVKDEVGAPIDLSAQISRIDNIDLAAGGAGHSGQGIPTPDMMREQLKRMELGVGGEPQEGEQKQEEAEGIFPCPESALSLFSAPSPVLVESEPPSVLHPLLIKLDALNNAAKRAEKHDPGSSRRPCYPYYALPTSQPDNLADAQVVSLTPIQFAVARKDASLVDLLVNLALDSVKDEESDKREGVTKKNPRAQIFARNRQFNSSHSNSPLELSMVVDDVAVFTRLACASEEYSLPVDALREWQHEIYLQEGSLTESEKLNYGQLVAMSSEQSPPLLHHALAMGSVNIVRALTKRGGEATEALLRWVLTAADDADANEMADESHRIASSNDPEGARAWLVRHVHLHGTKLQELYRRLIGADAKDKHGRTALFFAQDDSAIAAISAIVSDKDAADNEGCTAVMEAALWAESGRLAALLAAGCSATATHHPHKWNALHLLCIGSARRWTATVQRRRMATRGCTSTTQKEEEEREDTEAAEESIRAASRLLEAVDHAGARALFASPDAEHTPIMLGAAKGAHPTLLRWLVARLKELDVVAAVLARRDLLCNTAMHLAAASAEPKNEILEIFADADGSPVVCMTENARGATPLEIVKQAHAQEVWEAGAHQSYGALRLLEGVSEAKTRRGYRGCVSMDEVADAAKHSTKANDSEMSPADAALTMKSNKKCPTSLSFNLPIDGSVFR